MIQVRASTGRCIVTPTIFPDGTSQVWKLPDDIVEASHIDVDWRFESERELIDILSLKKLFRPSSVVRLHIPYLPYARQDKDVRNDSTFNLRVLADVLNMAGYHQITSVDVHNPDETADLIKGFRNIEVTDLHRELIRSVRPDYLVFPDLGARNRYYSAEFAHIPRVIFYKERDQLTGQITGHTLSYRDAQGITIQGADMGKIARPGERFLIIDDICDGGATFISIANKLRSQVDGVRIDLFVTHGLFSKGREILTANGINNVYTTNSLLKNGDGYGV